MKEIEFKITDQSLNSHGFRILTQGIDMSVFAKNPVALYAHDEYSVPIGKWKNWRIDTLDPLIPMYATLEFDQDDPKAMSLYDKCEKGYLRAVSISVRTTGTSSTDVVVGQKYETVTSCKMREVSLVTIPSNANAVRLCDEAGGVVSLSANDKQNILKPLYMDEMIELLRSEGGINLSDVSNVSDAVTTVRSLLSEKDTEIKRLSDALSLAQKDKIKNLLDRHIDRGVITEGERNFYTNAALQDYEGTEKQLASLRPRADFGKFIAGSMSNSD
ncbi:MAG: HK97 family phage prohead protease, partial [Flavobacteriales bacterium]|nr:HK97 family phage prohead protease [Flavobacteriales bacterium]